MPLGFNAWGSESDIINPPLSLISLFISPKRFLRFFQNGVKIKQRGAFSFYWKNFIQKKVKPKFKLRKRKQKERSKLNLRRGDFFQIKRSFLFFLNKKPNAISIFNSIVNLIKK